MNLKLRAMFVSLLCLLITTTVPGQQRRHHPAASVSGVYGDFTVGKESGDLHGMRVVIFNAGNAFHAIVQIAEGGAEDPQPQYTDVTVKNMKVEFAIGERKFSGTVSAAGLTLKGEDGNELLRRKPCSAFL